MNQALNKNNLPGYDEAYSTPLEDLDVSNPLIWPEQKMWAIFERLRNEDPIHYRKEAWMSDQRPEDMEPVGPYWSITRYEDIMAIDTDHQRFSSEPAIVLPNPAEDFPLPMFIAMDQATKFNSNLIEVGKQIYKGNTSGTWSPVTGSVCPAPGMFSGPFQRILRRLWRTGSLSDVLSCCSCCWRSSIRMIRPGS